MSVYILQSNNMFKIGYTNNQDVNKRVRNIQTNSPFDIVFIGYFKDEGYDFEQKLHKDYSQYRERGEWFKFPNSIINKITSSKKFTFVNKIEYQDNINIKHNIENDKLENILISLLSENDIEKIIDLLDKLELHISSKPINFNIHLKIIKGNIFHLKKTYFLYKNTKSTIIEEWYIYHLKEIMNNIKPALDQIKLEKYFSL